MQKDIVTETEFKTTDLSLAATLFTMDHTLLNLDKSDYQTKFVFELDETIVQHSQDYSLKRLKISPIDLLQNLKTLKHQLFN